MKGSVAGAYPVAMTVAAPRLGSEATTQGIRVEVSPSFMPDHSRPSEREFVFAYRVRITNVGQEAAQLVSRRWLIVDANGVTHSVEGPGVVGQQPRLEPGQSFEYSSYCPLKTAWGTMEGTFQMRRDDAGTFEAVVARFYLAGAPEASRTGA